MKPVLLVFRNYASDIIIRGKVGRKGQDVRVGTRVWADPETGRIAQQFSAIELEGFKLS